MLKIKADRMGELEKFGFIKFKENYWTFGNTDECDIGILADRTISIGTADYQARAITKGLKPLYDLIKADMVEEVTE